MSPGATEICPHCDGKKEISGIGCNPDDGCQPVTITCTTCRGVGRVSPDQIRMIEAGKRVRQARLRADLGIFDAAKYLHIPTTMLSAIEHGREPANYGHLVRQFEAMEKNPQLFKDAPP